MGELKLPYKMPGFGERQHLSVDFRQERYMYHEGLHKEGCWENSVEISHRKGKFTKQFYLSW